MTLVLSGVGIIALAAFAASRRRSRRLTHALATLLAGACLLLLALEKEDSRDLDRALLLTNGAGPEQVEEALAGDLPIFDLDTDRSWSRVDRRITSLPDLATLRRRHPKVQRLEVVGNGLESASWGSLRVSTHQPGITPSPGPTQIRWTRSLELGQTFEVVGELEPEKSASMLVLTGPDGRSQESPLDADRGASSFVFRDRPRSTGHLLYELRLGEDRWTLDVAVQSAEARRILWIEDSPGYESRFLVARWSEAGHALAVRRRISRDRYQTEFHGMEDVDLGRLRPDLLATLDLVAVDRPAWERLSDPEKRLLEAAIREQGVGLLFLDRSSSAEPAGPDALDELLSRFVVRPIPDLDSMHVRAIWQAREPAPSLELPAFYLESSSDIRPLVGDSQDRLLAASRPFGAGQIGYSLLTGTHAWILQGHESIHDSFWTHLLSALLRPRLRPGFLLGENRPLLQDRATPFVLRTDKDAPTVTLETPSAEEWPIALRQDDLDPTRWHGVFWPRESGLHGLQSEGLRMDFLVQSDLAWSSWLADLRRRETRERMEQEENDSQKLPPTSRRFRGLLFLIALLALAFSWTAEIL